MPAPSKVPRPPGHNLRLVFVLFGVLALLDAGVVWDGATGAIHQTAALVMVLIAAVLFVGAGIVHMLGRAVKALEAGGRGAA